MAKIKFKRTSTVGRRPTGLESGEIGINLADRKIFVGDDSGNIVQLGNDPITTERLEAKAGATITNGLTVSGNQSNTGNITVSGDVKSATSTVTGKATLGSVGTGALTATGVSTGTLTATGNTTLAGTKTGPLESTTLNATGVATVASLQTPGAISAGGNAVITGKVNAGSVETVSVVATGDVKGATLNATGKATVGSIGTGAITASSLVATGDMKSATVTTTGKAKSGSVETGAITGSTITATGNVTTSAKITANEIELTKYDNFDSRYIQTGTAITNATKLSTPRKIAGVNFDGSADISIPAANVGALPAAGGAMTGVLTSNSDITSTKVIQGARVQATARLSVLNTSSANLDLINPNIDTTTTLPGANAFLGYLRFLEGSKTSDVAGGANRTGFQAYIPANSDGVKALWDTRDPGGGAVKTRIHMDSATGLTSVDVGAFKAGTTTLGTTTTGALTASSATVNGTLTATGSLNLPSPNAGIELGSSTTAGTPFIDFNTKGNNVDYDMRILANQTELLITTPGVSHGLRMPYVDKLSLHATSASSIIMCRGTTILRDFGNGNVTLSASRKSDSDTVGGDLYIGYNASGFYTNKVRLESEMNWKGTNSLVNANGKLVGASLDTAYLPLTGGAMSGNINISRSGTVAIDMSNSTIDTSLALPSGNVSIGTLTFNETRGGTSNLRGRHEAIITSTGGTLLQSYVRDANNVNKVIVRLESDAGLFNVATGNFRVGGTTTLVGNVTASNTLTVAGQIRADNLALGGDIVSDIGAITVNGNIVTRLGSITAKTSLYSNGDGNSHLWFMNAAGTEKAVIFAGNDKVFNIRSNGKSFLFGEGAVSGIRVAEQVNGESNALIRGTVAAGGHADWRARSAGIQLDCPQANTSAYNVWKATAWSQAHIAAMDVHMNGFTNDGAIVRLLVSNSAFSFYGNGSMDMPSNLNANDVYIRSDERLKRNLVKLDSALDKVDQLNGYSYEKKMSLDSDEYTKQEAGLIAQELREVLPEAVSEHEKTSVLTISPSAVNALLVEAIKELRQEVKELKCKMKGV